MCSQASQLHDAHVIYWQMSSLTACRQLGLRLHALDSPMPLYDAVTGQPVSLEVDVRVEKLRDQLMDEARERVDELGEEAVTGECRLWIHT